MEYRVLVADDEPLALKSVCLIIEQRCENYKIAATAENGQEALQKIREYVPDLVICDIKMPLLSGVELAAIIRKEFPEICFIIVSGYQDFEYAQSAIRSGVTDYLLKPIVPSALLNSLEHAAVKIRKIHYTECNRILWTIGNGKKADMQKLKCYIPYRQYYGAILRTNGLPRRFAMDKTREIYSDINEQFLIFGRDEMEALYLIPKKLLSERDFLRYMEKIQKQRKEPDYYTLIYDSRPFSVNELQEKIRKMYQELDLRSSVGITQCVNLAEPLEISGQQARELRELEENIMMELEAAARTKKAGRIRSEIRKGYSALEKYRPSQLWMENFTREIMAVMRQNGLSRISVPESEYLLSDAFFYAVSVKMLTDSLMDIFLNFQREELEEGKADSQEYFDKIEHYLKLNLGKPIMLMELCHQFGISQPYMSRLFRKYSGNSFSQHLTELRMNRAKELFREKPDSFIKDVAAMVGYEDQFYFSRLFRSYTGKSPSEFLKEIADEEESIDLLL